MSSNQNELSDETHPCNRKGLELDEGDEVLFNDRQRPLTVTGEHSRPNHYNHVYGRRQEADEYRVIELEGNGTAYHLLCLEGSESGPMLYKEADWDEDKTNRHGDSPRYSRMGERVESMEVVDGE